jgi:hypothetical protein
MPTTPTRDELIDLIALKIPYVTKEFGRYTAMRILQHLEENGVVLVPTDGTKDMYGNVVDHGVMSNGGAHMVWQGMIATSPYRGIRVPDSSPFVLKVKSEPAAEPLIKFVGPYLTVPEECLFPEPLVGFDAGDGSSD